MPFTSSESSFPPLCFRKDHTGPPGRVYDKVGDRFHAVHIALIVKDADQMTRAFFLDSPVSRHEPPVVSRLVIRRTAGTDASALHVY
jgi:hypothetical protein